MMSNSVEVMHMSHSFPCILFLELVQLYASQWCIRIILNYGPCTFAAARYGDMEPFNYP